MQPSIHLLPLTNAHSAQVAGLILPIQRDEFHVPITLADQPDLLDIENFYFRPGGHFWGAFVDDQLAGTIGLLVPPQQTQPEQTQPQQTQPRQLQPQHPDNLPAYPPVSFGVIRKMFVRASFRGAPWHLAQQLLTTLIRYSRENKLDHLYLGTINHMAAAHRFYERNGFVRVAKEALPPSFPLMAVDNVFYKIEL